MSWVCFPEHQENIYFHMTGFEVTAWKLAIIYMMVWLVRHRPNSAGSLMFAVHQAIVLWPGYSAAVQGPELRWCAQRSMLCVHATPLHIDTPKGHDNCLQFLEYASMTS